MKQIKHNYINIEKEQEYISDMLKQGYVLKKVNRNMYTFEENKGKLIDCKAILVQDDDYGLFEKINVLVENGEIEKAEALMEKEKRVVMYLYTDDKKKLSFVKSNINCVVAELRQKIDTKTKNMTFALIFTAIFIAVSPWVAIIEIIIGLWCLFDIVKYKKRIKNIEVPQC